MQRSSLATRLALCVCLTAACDGEDDDPSTMSEEDTSSDASGTGTGTESGTESGTGGSLEPGEDCELRTSAGACDDPVVFDTPYCRWTEVTRVTAEQAASCPATAELETVQLCLTVTATGDPGCGALPNCNGTFGVRPEGDGSALFVPTCALFVEGFESCASGAAADATHPGCVCVCD